MLLQTLWSKISTANLMTTSSCLGFDINFFDVKISDSSDPQSTGDNFAVKFFDHKSKSFLLSVDNESVMISFEVKNFDLKTYHTLLWSFETQKHYGRIQPTLHSFK